MSKKAIKTKQKAQPVRKEPAQPDPNAWQAAPEARDLLTPELIRLLNAIPEPHAAKKRTTVRRLAFALANGEDVKTVFNHDDTCAEAIWYGKWKHDPDIAMAFEAYKARVLQWRDEETARLEAHYRAIRLQKIAQHAASAPDALHEVMTGTEQRGSDRINAATKLISLADPETAERVNLNQPGGDTVEQTVNIETVREKRWNQVAPTLADALKEQAGEQSNAQ